MVWRSTRVASVDDRYWGRFVNLSARDLCRSSAAMKSSDGISSLPIDRFFRCLNRCTELAIAGDLLGELLLLSVDPGRMAGRMALTDPNPTALGICFSLLHSSLPGLESNRFWFDDNDRAAEQIVRL